MKSELEVIEFFRQIHKLIQKNGLEKVLNQLKQINVFNGDKFERDVCDYIVSITANNYFIEKGLILNSSKRGKVSESRRMCFALIKEHLTFSDEEIGVYFGGRSRQYISRELKNLPLNQDRLSKVELKFVNDFMELTKKVLEYKNTYSFQKSE